MFNKVEKRPMYNEKKATQSAVLLLKLNDGHMNYMKLIKLLYNIDREAMRQWARPVTYDDLFSLPHGLVVSKTLDKAETGTPIYRSYWDNFIRTEGRDNVLTEDCGDDELSPAEIDLIIRLDKKYKHKGQFDMRREHHNPRLFPEYIDPKGSSIRMSYAQVFHELGFDDDDIAEITSEMEELFLLEEALA